MFKILSKTDHTNLIQRLTDAYHVLTVLTNTIPGKYNEPVALSLAVKVQADEIARMFKQHREEAAAFERTAQSIRASGIEDRKAALAEATRVHESATVELNERIANLEKTVADRDATIKVKQDRIDGLMEDLVVAEAKADANESALNTITDASDKQKEENKAASYAAYKSGETSIRDEAAAEIDRRTMPEATKRANAQDAAKARGLRSRAPDFKNKAYETPAVRQVDPDKLPAGVKTALADAVIGDKKKAPKRAPKAKVSVTTKAKPKKGVGIKSREREISAPKEPRARKAKS